MHKQGDLIYKGSPPTSEAWCNTLENPTITLLPNAPASQNGYFIKTMTFEAFPCSTNHLQSGPWIPRNLQIVPYSSTELAVKE
jgi:hypothetical protein